MISLASRQLVVVLQLLELAVAGVSFLLARVRSQFSFPGGGMVVAVKEKVEREGNGGGC